MGVHYNKADFITYGRPSLFLDFANKKSLTDRISGNNLITFTRTSTGTYVGADGLIKSATTNEARFDHNPTTLESLGLLIEEQRTNYHTNNSNNLFTMSYSNWTSDSSILYPNGGTVGGYNTFDQLSGVRFFLDYNPGPGNATYTCSVYARLKTGSSATICSVVVKDFQSDTVRGSSGSITLTTSWQRITATGTTAGGTAGLRFEIGTNTNGASSQIYLWGAQVEQGSFPTSYIPTTDSQVTRNADSASITGTNFSSWYNATEGNVFCSARLLKVNPTTSSLLWSIGDSATFNESMYLVNENTLNYITFNMIDGGVNQAQFSGSTITSGSFNKISISYKLNDSAASYNASTPTTDTSCTLPTVNSLKIGNASWGSGNPLNGTIAMLSYYPVRFSNSNLQKITT
jgi:hypothetical protein